MKVELEDSRLNVLSRTETHYTGDYRDAFLYTSSKRLYYFYSNNAALRIFLILKSRS
jgi:hypothetical protein